MYDHLYEKDTTLRYHKCAYQVTATLTITQRVDAEGREDAVDRFLDYLADTYPELEAEVDFVAREYDDD